MDRINSQHADKATLARKVLSWVFHASRPLTILEIQHALAVEAGDTTLDEDNIPEEELLLSVCNGLVTYGKEGGFLTLVHYTFQQYLEQKAETLFPNAQADIARTCLTYLSFDDFEQGPFPKGKGSLVRLERWPLLSYAASKWGYHARQGAEEACRDMILSFLSQDVKMSASVQILLIRESTGLYHVDRFAYEVSALWLASFYGLEYTVSCLLASQRYGVDGKTTWGDTALHGAARCGNLRILDMILSKSTDVIAKDGGGDMSLRLRFSFGSAYDISRLLLDGGAHVNAVTFRGETALYLAILSGQKWLARLLLTRGADVTLENDFGLAPLTLASDAGDEEFVQMLLEHDLQKQIQCGIVDNAIRKAAVKGNLSLLRLLLARSPELPPPDPEGRNLLHLSAYGGDLGCLQYLENCGFDLKAQDKKERTSLHIAATGTHAASGAILEYLLERGLNPSQGDVDGWTPLLWAAKAGNITNIRILLKADDCSFRQNDRDWIPYAIATYHEHRCAAAILRPPNRPLPSMFQTPRSTLSLRHPKVICGGCELVCHRNLDYFISSEGGC